MSQPYDDRHFDNMCHALRKGTPDDGIGCIRSKGHTGKHKDLNGEFTNAQAK